MTSAARLLANLPRCLLGALLCCAACSHPKIAREPGFRLLENGDAPMLVPADTPTSNPGDFQTTTLVLPGSSAAARNPANPPCSIDGEVFSLRPASPPDKRSWIIRSPSISGWDALAGRFEMSAQWKSFTRALDRLPEDACFPAGLTTLEMRVAVAQRIPLPTNQVALFLYSDQGTGFADLSPGMEIRLQRFLPPAGSSGANSEGPRQIWVAGYEVVPRPGKGVGLKLARRPRHNAAPDAGAEAGELLSLAQRFGQTPVLRLFLEGVYGTGKVSHGILIGASTQTQIDALTQLIHQSDPARCLNSQGTVCMEFPLGAVSLSSSIFINGRQTPCLFGESLAALLRDRPQPEQTTIFQSLQVLRRVQPGRYAAIDFPRTLEGAAQLVLLPGDKITWQH
ncbi:hypothetical protein DYQ86_10195 [Acidobacteria bacterium AB60]|nr:hypothetical protein DYQ86_10195 [Acidobacteria bacterium AB60]